MNRYVMRFEEIDKSHLPLVGGKGANLGEMTRAGFPVPPGFCVTTSAYVAFTAASSEMDYFYGRLADVDADDLGAIRDLGKQIREHLQSVPIPDGIQEEIRHAWMRSGEHRAFAVRSSATAEDLPTASFAGQQETFLNVKGWDPLLRAIRDCWASLFTDRAIVYRIKNGFGHRSVYLSVVVQEMVFPEVSGIMFTADPISGHRKTISIDAGYGLGEALVSGLVSADLYQVRPGAIVKKQVSRKKIAIYALPEGGTVTRDLPEELQEKQALTDSQIIELARLGRRIETYYGSEQDIEWCLADGKFYVVQSRPITSLYPVPPIEDDSLHVLFSFGHQQMMTDAMPPLALSVLRTMFPFGKPSVRSESTIAHVAGGRLYIDLTYLLRIKPARTVVTRALSGMDEMIASGVAEVLKRGEILDPAKTGPAVKKRMIRFARPIIGKVLRNLLFADTSRKIESVNAFMNNYVADSAAYLAGASGASRIRRIQENAGTLILTLMRNVLPSPLTGIAAFQIIRLLTEKWLGNSEGIHLLNKSLPGNVTSEMGLMIGDLADIARKHAEVLKHLETGYDGTFRQRMKRTEGGTLFLNAWDEFMRLFGMRCPGEIDITRPRWREDPSTLIPSLLSHIRSVPNGEHRIKFAQGLKEAEEAAENIVARLKATRFGAVKAKWVARLIRVYRDVMGIRELPKYIMVRHLALYREAILEEGRALADRGILRHPDDIYYLSLEEIASLLEGSHSFNAAGLIERRKKEHERNRKLTPPRLMTSEGEIITGKRKHTGAPEGAFIGTPVSAGVAEGVARIVLRPEEADLQPGEILVAPFTDPGWTPLFHSAKGLVMEVGGMMTHGAVVAREYGIPAVVGIDNATQIIKNGDRIRIDGTQGFVLRVNGGSRE